MASFRASRPVYDSSAISNLHHHLLHPSPEGGDGSDYSDGVDFNIDVDEGKLETSLPSKPSFRSSQGPITESFTISSSCSAHPRRALPNFCRRLPTFFSRAFKPRWSCSSHNGSHRSSLGFEAPFSQRPKPVRRLIYVCLGILIMLGVVQLITLGFGVIAAFFPDDIHSIIEHWGQVGRHGEGLNHWPTDFTRDVVPIACHSHNDYWRKVPLFSAISAGCIGVEADVWMFEEELYVGHTTSSLTLNRTLRNLYINPLLEILDKQNPTHKFNPNASNPLNGIFDTVPGQTLSLLIDFKTSGPAAFPYVVSQLAPLRDRGYLTYFDGKTTIPGPITIVATGNAPFNSIIQNMTYRDIFYDAPLKDMGVVGRKWANLGTLSDAEIDYRRNSTLNPVGPENGGLSSRFLPQDQGQGSSGHPKTLDPDVFNPQNSYYASVALPKAIGHLWRRKLSDHQIGLIKSQVRGAHRRGLKARYWELPKWPIGLRNQVWEILVEEGVDLLNVDDLQSAARKDWKQWKGWWSSRESDHVI